MLCNAICAILEYKLFLKRRARNNLLRAIHTLQQHPHKLLPINRLHNITIRVPIALESLVDVFFPIFPLVGSLRAVGRPRFSVSFA
jgi:hypothetical protein